MSNTNTVNDLFVIAARKKFRFSTPRGEINVEDLFDSNLASLDNIAVALDEKIQKAGRKSFVQKKTASTTELENHLEIVKFIIEVKQTEADEEKKRKEKLAQRAFLLSLKEKKQMEELEGLSIEEIEKRLAVTE